MALSVEQLDTPCLVLDLKRTTRNAALMLARCRQLGVTLRPHVKTPKSIELAKLALARETGPITVSTLHEARHFAESGFKDILYATAIVPAKLPQIFAIQRETGAQIHVVLDSVTVAQNLAAFPSGGPSVLSALIEIDCGEHRSGISPDDDVLLKIARELAQSPSTKLAGVMTHAGHSYESKSKDELRQVAAKEREAALTASKTLTESGFPCPQVSIGSTPTILHVDHLNGVTEVRCGVYLLWDLSQVSRHICEVTDIAATVLATVIGHNRASNSIVIDAGALALSKDIGANKFMPGVGYGLICDSYTCMPLSPLAVTQVHQEHGTISISDLSWFNRLQIGSLVRVLPNHICMTAAAYKEFHVLQNGKIVDSWKRVSGWR